MKRLAIIAVLLSSVALPAHADYVVRDGNNVLQTITAGLVAGKILPFMTAVDQNGTYVGTSSNPWAITFGAGVTLPAFASPPTVVGTFWPYSLGQQLAAGSIPVVLTAAQLATLTPPTTVPTGAATSANQTTLGNQTTKINDGTNTAAVKAASTPAATTDSAVVTTTSPNSPEVPFAAYSKASITRAGNTTTYTANTGWNNGTPTFFSFTASCRVNGAQVLIPRIDIWSSANPTLKLSGILWIFSAVPGTNVSDDATFTIAPADFANLTGSFSGFPFTLANNQISAGAANSSTSLIGTTYQAQCASGSTTITGMVEVTNAYVPANAEVLNVGIATVGAN